MTNGSEPRIRQIRTVRDTADFWLKATRSAWVVQPEFPWRRLEVDADLVHRDQPTTVLPDCNTSWWSVWVQPPTLSTAATSRCRPTPAWHRPYSCRRKSCSGINPLAAWDASRRVPLI